MTRPEKILVVDDEPTVRTVIGRILRHDGYTVGEAGGMAEALEEVRRNSGQVDLLICDVVLNQERCAALVERLQRLFPAIQVLLISGLPLDILTEHHLLPPAILTNPKVYHRQKPFSRTDLLEEVSRILRTDSYRGGGGGRRRGSEPHIEERQIDEYATGTLPATHVAMVEEHLLECELCQTRLVQAEEFSALFREAAQEFPQPLRAGWKERLRPWLRWHPAGWAMAAATILMLVVGMPNLRHQVPSDRVTLQSLRGPESTVLARAGKPLQLVLDVPAEAAGTVQIVDLSGKTVFEKAAEVREGHASVRVVGLKRGDYWVRVFGTAAEPEPLAEYALKVQ